MRTRLLSVPKLIVSYLRAHAVLSAIVIFAAAGASYWGYTTYFSTANETRYVLGKVERGTIVATISGSGQVAASDETELKPHASGEITSVLAKAGDRVKQGQVLAYIDATAARQAVTDAQIAVEEAQLNLEHDTLQAPIDYKKLQEDVARAERDLDNAYNDGYIALSNAYISLPDVVTGANGILYNKDIDSNVPNVSAYQNLFISADSDRIAVRSYLVQAEDDFNAADAGYRESLALFKSLPRSAPTNDIKSSIDAAQNMATLLSKAVVSEANMIDTVIGILDRRDWAVDSDIAAAQTRVRTYVTSANSVLTSLTTAQKNIQTAEDALTDARHALELASVGNPTGDNPFDLKLLQNTLKQKLAALADAQQTLADHAIRAPFSGVLATLTVRRGDTASSATSVGTLISDQQIAELSLNEVDAAQIEIGDKTTLTFDAVEDLSLTGKVAEIDPVGTVSQGVVSYTIKIGLDTQDARIKPGMTANASVTIDVKTDVLKVPSSAVKTQNSQSYVLVFSPELPLMGDAEGITSAQTPNQTTVQTGISDDSTVEIISGLTEGEQIVVRTTTTSANTSTTNSSRNSGFGGPGIRL